jgi:hypothetical protein
MAVVRWQINPIKNFSCYSLGETPSKWHQSRKAVYSWRNYSARGQLMKRQLPRTSLYFILFTLLGSLLAVTTAISANAADLSYSEEAIINVDCPDEDCPGYVAPPAMSCEKAPTWAPSIDAMSKEDTWLPGEFGVVYMNLRFEDGLAVDCTTAIKPSGRVSGSFDITDENWGEESECSDDNCLAKDWTQFGGYFTVPAKAALTKTTFSATYTVTWTP